MRLDILIPVYNEGPNILRTLQALADHVSSSYRVLICYDFEEDNTLSAIRGNNIVCASRFMHGGMSLAESCSCAQCGIHAALFCRYVGKGPKQQSFACSRAACWIAYKLNRLRDSPTALSCWPNVTVCDGPWRRYRRNGMNVSRARAFSSAAMAASLSALVLLYLRNHVPAASTGVSPCGFDQSR